MRASVINQYPAGDSTAKHLATLLNDFASYQAAQFRGLVAFASESGLRIIEPDLRSFLAAGHHAFWIVGVDLGGTGRPALEFLYNLKREYPKQMDARVFSAADNLHIFHPKVYWLDSKDRKVIVTGSANATTGGFRQNFEASLVLDLEPLTDEQVLEELDFLWITYTSPLPPLSPGNLLELNQSLINRFGPDGPPTDARSNEPHPLRGLAPRPRRVVPARTSPKRKSTTRAILPGREFIMDILEETRQTQVQLPVDALTSFFGRAESVRLQQVRRGRIVKSDARPIIHLSNNTHRIEIDAIRGLPRPQIIRFRKSGRQSPITYEILLNGTTEHDEANRLLSERGHQTRHRARRWLLM